jgi:phosphate starvation-inducible protein PhoH
MIINGDLNQNKWNPNYKENGLKDLIKKLKEKYPTYELLSENNIEFIELQKEDIVRHPMVSKIISLYND